MPIITAMPVDSLDDISGQLNISMFVRDPASEQGRGKQVKLYSVWCAYEKRFVKFNDFIRANPHLQDFRLESEFIYRDRF
jgi:hypothetical protein